MSCGPAVRILFVLLLASLAVHDAAAQDIGEGERIARQWCGNCHQIERYPARTSDAIPSFSAIAQMPSTTQASLAAFLSSSHGRMPDYALTRSEIRDVSAYILSLRDRSGR